MDEFRFKLLTIRKLLLLKPELIATEVPFFGSRRRADILTIWNGSSHVFEIKSERDNLSKLYEQLNDYCSNFDFVTVVVSDKLLLKKVDTIPTRVGIVSVSSGSTMKVLRRARQCKRLSKRNLALSFDKPQLLNLIESKRKSNTGTYKELVEWAEKRISINDLNSALKHQWTQKYAQSYKLFLDESGKALHEDDLLNFGRSLELR